MESIISRTGTAAALVLGALMASGCAGDQKLVASSDELRLSKIQPPSLIWAAGGAGECKADEGLCEIKVEIVQGSSGTYCLATARNMSVPSKEGALPFDKRTIGWKLSTAELDSRPIRFHAESGIVIVTDGQDQIDRGGTLGQTPGPNPVSTFSVKTKRNKKKATSIYLPVVLWERKLASGQLEYDLCAAVDPKIVNAE